MRDDDRDLSIGLVDDAAATGGTLCAAARLAAAQGLRVSTMRVCASTDKARRRVRESLGGLTVSVCVPGNWRIMHLRANRAGTTRAVASEPESSLAQLSRGEEQSQLEERPIFPRREYGRRWNPDNGVLTNEL